MYIECWETSITYCLVSAVINKLFQKAIKTGSSFILKTFLFSYEASYLLYLYTILLISMQLTVPISYILFCF